jgi:hypothetical protein
MVSKKENKMKLTKAKLKQIIKEELRKLTVEADTAVPVGDMTRGEHFVHVHALPKDTGLAELIDQYIADSFRADSDDLKALKRELRQHRKLDKAAQAKALAQFIDPQRKIG